MDTRDLLLTAWLAALATHDRLPKLANQAINAIALHASRLNRPPEEHWNLGTLAHAIRADPVLGDPSRHYSQAYLQTLKEAFPPHRYTLDDILLTIRHANSPRLAHSKAHTPPQDPPAPSTS